MFKGDKALVIFLLAMTAFIIFSTKTAPRTNNELSRLLTIRSLIERGQLNITSTNELSLADGGKISRTTLGDTTFDGHRWYSDKPPLMSIIASGVYKIFQKISGNSLPSPVELNYNGSFYLLALTFSGLPFLILLYLFYQSLNFIKLNNQTKLLLTIILALTTLLLPYATVFSNHLLVAILIYGAFYCLLILKDHPKQKNYISLLAGLLAGLAIAVDIPVGIIFWLAVLLFLRLTKGLSLTLWYIAGSLPGLAITLILNFITTGTLLPMYVMSKFYHLLPENNWRTDINILRPQEIMSNIWKAFFGNSGIMILTPILFFSLWSGWKTIKNNSYLKSETLLILISSIFYMFGIIIVSNDLGGSTFGMRWFLPFVAPWFWILAQNLPRRYSILFYLLILLTVISFIIALTGLTNPWATRVIGQELQPYALINILYYLHIK